MTDTKCTCDKIKLDLFWKSTTRYDEFGNIIWNFLNIFRPVIRDTKERIYDSFGWRNQFPGECDECYKKFQIAYKKLYNGL